MKGSFKMVYSRAELLGYLIMEVKFMVVSRMENYVVRQLIINQMVSLLQANGTRIF